VSDALADRYDAFLVDLDGVVYLGQEAVSGAPAALVRLRERGRAIAYVTNNASRRPWQVAALLADLGAPATAEDVVTSAQATAAILADRLPPGSAVLVVGGDALGEELTDVGLRPVRSAAHDPVAVAQGYAPEVGWAQLAEGCIAVRAGAMWVATNADRTLPSERGPLPGNGSLVAALATALDREPDLVVGKPGPALFEQAARSRSARRPIVVGDRLDTDIEGANRAGMDSVLVLTGVSRAADLLAAPPARRPTYVAAELAGLFEPAEVVRVAPDGTTDGDSGANSDSGADSGSGPNSGSGASGAEAAGWRAYPRGGDLVLDGAGPMLGALRALCAEAWKRHGQARHDGEAVTVRASGPDAQAALAALGLPDATAASGA
jgi:glycerol-1-phosphatase